MKLENLSVEELACEYRKINEILSSDDRAQPLSSAEVKKLEQDRRDIVREFWYRGLVQGGWIDGL